MSTRIRFNAKTLTKPDALVFVGTAKRLLSAGTTRRLPKDVRAQWKAMVEATKPGDGGAATTTWRDGAGARRIVACVLPDVASRHNSPGRPDAIYRLVKQHTPKRGRVWIVAAVAAQVHAFAAAAAVARGFPLYSEKAGGSKRNHEVAVTVLGPRGVISVDGAQAVAEGIRLAQRLVDAPTNVLHTDAFVDEARAVAEDVGASITIVQGEALRDQGFGGLWSVGRCATRPPALVILTHAPPRARKNIVWVGKGIVYDTGGLSLKGKTFMPGMKRDMGGAAAVLGAFSAAVKSGCRQRLHAVLCLAENAIGPEATRPDDVITMYSGKTVEVNNTDAEGRLVLGDGVAYAVKHLKPHVMVDLATLTGAQLMATGRRHAAIMCNDDALEARAIKAGRSSGDLVHPLPYCPEFYRKEFKSVVADMKNSVKDRMNAQSSCAGQFVGNHLGKWKGPWLHVDLAGPVHSGERATGFGVALLVSLLRTP